MNNNTLGYSVSVWLVDLGEIDCRTNESAYMVVGGQEQKASYFQWCLCYLASGLSHPTQGLVSVGSVPISTKCRPLLA